MTILLEKLDEIELHNRLIGKPCRIDTLVDIFTIDSDDSSIGAEQSTLSFQRVFIFGV